MALNDVEGAVKEAQRALAIEPDNLDAATVISSERLSRGDTQGALEALEKGKVTPGRRFPSPCSGSRSWIVRKITRGRSLELRKLVDLQPNAFRKALIKFYVDRGRALDAEDELRAAADKDPADVEAFLDLVRFQHANKRPDIAERKLEERIEAGGTSSCTSSPWLGYRPSAAYDASAVRLLERAVAASTVPDRKVKAQLELATTHVRRKNLAAAEPIIAED